MKITFFFFTLLFLGLLMTSIFCQNMGRDPIYIYNQQQKQLLENQIRQQKIYADRHAYDEVQAKWKKDAQNEVERLQREKNKYT